jgi:hypothetical protein
MPDISELLREELKRAAERVQPEHLRPLRIPVRRHRWRLRLVPAAAAAAVIIIVAVAVLAAGTPTGHRPAAPFPRSSVTIPRYYVTISRYVVPLQAVVRDSANGQVTGAVTVPAVVRADVADITAAADDRSFIIGAYDVDPAGTMDYRLFRLRISASGRPAPLTELLVIALPRPATTVGGIALSPDGTKVAISLQYQVASMDSIPYGGIEVVDLATRATRTWIAPRDDYLSWPGQPSWADGDTMVAFTWWHSTGLAGRISASSTEVRELDTATAGTDLLDSRVIVPASGIGDLESALITPDGKAVIAAVYQDHPASGGQRGTLVAQIIELLPDTGRIVAVARIQTARYASLAERETLIQSARVLAIDASGEHALVQCFQLGRLSIGSVGPGQFAALPGASASDPRVAVAW